MTQQLEARADWRRRGVVLVTGATGYTGGHLARTLLAQGAKVRALVRNPSRAREIQRRGAEIVTGDVTSRTDLERAIAGVSTVFHVAAIFREASHRESEYMAVNAEAPRVIVELASRAGVERVMHCSTIGVHGDVGDQPGDENAPYAPGDVYQVSKLEGELAAIDAASRLGVPLSVVRPATIYGPGDRRMFKLFAGVARRRFPVLGSGEVKLHPIYIDDLVDGMLLAATREEAIGRTYILAGPDAVTLNEAVATVAELCNVPVPRLHLPVWPFWLAGAMCEAVCVPLHLEPPIFRRRVAFFTKSRSFDITRARRELGYDPQFDWRTGAQRTLEWYRAAGWLTPVRAPRRRPARRSRRAASAG